MNGIARDFYGLQANIFHLQSYCSHFWLTTYPVYGLVADVRDAGKDGGLIVWNGEIAAFVTDSTTKQRGVYGIEDGNIGIRYGLALLVNNGASQMVVGFVGTLNVNFAVIGLHSHADGIEAYHLLDGIGHGFAMRKSSNSL